MHSHFARIIRYPARLWNAVRTLRAGLPLGGENVSPEAATDLFRAHESIYHFASGYARGRSVLDVGCGTAYGSHLLRNAGATRVVGIDIGEGNIRYARRKFGRSDGIDFIVSDVANADAHGRFDVVVSSNVLEHVPDVQEVFSSVRRALTPDGVLIAAVPPIVDEHGLAENQRNPYHHTNLYVHEWLALLERFFGTVRLFEHHPPPDYVLDFMSPFRSAVDPRSFRFAESELTRFAATQSLTAVFVAEHPLPREM